MPRPLYSTLLFQAVVGSGSALLGGVNEAFPSTTWLARGIQVCATGPVLSPAWKLGWAQEVLADIYWFASDFGDPNAEYSFNWNGRSMQQQLSGVGIYVSNDSPFDELVFTVTGYALSTG